MESFGKYARWIVVILVMVLLSACNGGSYAIRSGSIDVYNDSMEGAYKSFSGYFFKELELEEGDVVRFCLNVHTLSGDLDFTLEDKEGNTVIGIESDLIWEVAESGRYRIYAAGEKHCGDFCLNWVEMPADGYSTGMEVADPDAFVVEMLSKDMTEAEEYEVMHQLQFIDRRRISEIDSEIYPKLMEWLYQMDDEKKMSCLSYLFLLDGLDGAYAEGYSALVGELFLFDTERFVRCLSCMSEPTIERIIGFLDFHLEYNNDTEYMDVLERLMNDESESVVKIVEELLE